MRPFREGDSHSMFMHLLDSITSEISALNNEYILKASISELEDHYISKALIDPIVLHTKDKYIKNQSGTKIEIRNDFSRSVFPDQVYYAQGTKITIAIPFEGDPQLWKVRASTFSLSGYPEITIIQNEIQFNISFADDSSNSDQILSEINYQTRQLEDAVKYLRIDIATHNSSVPNIIKQEIERKRKLAQSTIGVISALGIPIKRVGEIPTYTIPTKRRANPISLPSVSSESYKAEPVLAEKEYLYILEILKSMSLVIERNPSSFSSLDEEAIRDHFLLQLNGHYEGSATGETFNASGKTDILIRVENKNVFIAECKFWHGQKAFSEAVDQLLNYLTWRDSKCALLVFNKTKDTNGVRLKMHEVMESLPVFRKTENYSLTGDSRYVLIKKAEPGKEIIVTTQLYEMPSRE